MDGAQSVDPPARFGRGEQVTVLITAAADAEYDVRWGARELPVVSLDLPGRPAARVDITYDRPGVDLIHGDIRPTLIQALKDAKDYHHDGLCGDPEHTAWVEQYERALDILDPRPVLTCALPAPDPA